MSRTLSPPGEERVPYKGRGELRDKPRHTRTRPHGKRGTPEAPAAARAKR